MKSCQYNNDNSCEWANVANSKLSYSYSSTKVVRAFVYDLVSWHRQGEGGCKASLHIHKHKESQTSLCVLDINVVCCYLSPRDPPSEWPLNVTSIV